jgi:hypothetical protein
MSRRLGGSLVGPALVARAAPCWAHGDLAQKPATSTDPVQGLGETGYGVWRTHFVAAPGRRNLPTSSGCARSRSTRVEIEASHVSRIEMERRGKMVFVSHPTGRKVLALARV